ncbi:MAG: XdhC family protein, partial [Desulfobacterales bacterium]|nr:XdhC family protein [Desulfobacterales bacterium]
MESHLKDIYALLESGKKVVLARIIKQSGSTPRAAGTKCLILEDGSLLGTIGGGILEHQVQEKAKEVFKTGQSAIIHFQLTSEEVAKTEMICGGIADVLLEPIFPGCAAAVEVFRKIDALNARGRRGVLITLAAEGIGYEDEA